MACGVTEGVGVLRPLLSQSGPEDGTSFSFSLLEAESTTKASQGHIPPEAPGGWSCLASSWARPPPSRLCPSCGSSTRVCTRVAVCEGAGGCMSPPLCCDLVFPWSHLQRPCVHVGPPVGAQVRTSHISWGTRFHLHGHQQSTCLVNGKSAFEERENLQRLLVPVLSSLCDCPPGWPWSACRGQAGFFVRGGLRFAMDAPS